MLNQKKLNAMKTLAEITGKESGIIVYNDDVIIAANWSSPLCVGLPRVTPIDKLMWGFDEELTIISESVTNNCLAELPESDEAYITEEELDSVRNAAGVIYLIESSTGDEVKVICPYDWH